MAKPSKPSSENNYNAEQAERLLSSFQRLTGKSLIPAGITGNGRYKALYDAEFPVLSHNAEADPKLDYSNAAGMVQFEISWEELIKLPSRYTAEPQIQEERDRLLKAVTDNGFIDDYQGVRISAKQNRFFVEEAIVWNIVDDEGTYWGQGAVLYKCKPL
ncbi:MEKHLA domain-containing protein [Neptuniibacter sp.]|uniref:MEKHLA domain-containing protein n=1 Tax=Neptuniibacter sp. TaxID=1962643 RepID=UPI002625E7B4|nr:MEKHLA domain-containing protein [Neptuniibacter sp.]MCP4596462.1 MEKHLA domain-containing protein [Neptuniibacter sp.]